MRAIDRCGDPAVRTDGGRAKLSSQYVTSKGDNCAAYLGVGSDAGPAAVFGTAGSADAKQWQVGDKVQAYNVDWYNGTIAEVGTGSYQGYYLIKWDDFAGQQYIAEANIRARPGTAPSAWSTDRAALDTRCVGCGHPAPSG